MEKSSGMQLEWYRDYMVYTTKTIDYSVDSVSTQGQVTIAELNNFGGMPMPVDVKVTLMNRSSYYYTIPLDLMLGNKSQMDPEGKPYKVLEEWKWVLPVYWLVIPFDKSSIREIVVDPDHAMADMDRANNFWPRQKENE
jgi:hypothetical protein